MICAAAPSKGLRCSCLKPCRFQPCLTRAADAFARRAQRVEMQKGDFLIFIKAPRWLDDWSCPVTELFKRLDCTATGLSSDQARARLSAAPVPTRSRPQGFMRLAGEPLVLILIAGALVALHVGDWLDAAIVWCIVLLSAVLSAWYENRASTAVEQLRNKMALHATVLRDASIVQVGSHEGGPRRHRAAERRKPSICYMVAAECVKRRFYRRRRLPGTHGAARS